jgi:hypothetical protein
MAALVARNLPLRHPAENPTFILMVVLNFATLAVLIDFNNDGGGGCRGPVRGRGTGWRRIWRTHAPGSGAPGGGLV